MAAAGKTKSRVVGARVAGVFWSIVGTSVGGGNGADEGGMAVGGTRVGGNGVVGGLGVVVVAGGCAGVGRGKEGFEPVGGVCVVAGTESAGMRGHKVGKRSRLLLSVIRLANRGLDQGGCSGVVANTLLLLLAISGACLLPLMRGRCAYGTRSGVRGGVLGGRG